jgi:hypothetical protein
VDRCHRCSPSSLPNRPRPKTADGDAAASITWAPEAVADALRLERPVRKHPLPGASGRCVWVPPSWRTAHDILHGHGIPSRSRQSHAACGSACGARPEATSRAVATLHKVRALIDAQMKRDGQPADLLAPHSDLGTNLWRGFRIGRRGRRLEDWVPPEEPAAGSSSALSNGETARRSPAVGRANLES